MPTTLFEKIWEAHEVADNLLYVDLHLVHEVTSPQAFDGLRLENRPVRRPDRTLATADHNVPTDGTPVAELGRGSVVGEMALATGRLRNATVTSTSPLDLLHIDVNEFRSLLERRPTLRTSLLARLAAATA